MWRNKYISMVGLYATLVAVTLGIDSTTEQEIRAVLSARMSQVRQQLPESPLGELRKKYGVAMVPYIEQYLSDPHPRVRWTAYAQFIAIGVDANDLAARKGIVDKLVAKLRDDEDPGNRSYLTHRLLWFRAGDFSEEAKGLIRNRLSGALGPENYRYTPRYTILLVGVADLRSELPRLERLITER